MHEGCGAPPLAPRHSFHIFFLLYRTMASNSEFTFDMRKVKFEHVEYSSNHLVFEKTSPISVCHYEDVMMTLESEMEGLDGYIGEFNFFNIMWHIMNYKISASLSPEEQIWVKEDALQNEQLVKEAVPWMRKEEAQATTSRSKLEFYKILICRNDL